MYVNVTDAKLTNENKTPPFAQAEFKRAEILTEKAKKDNSFTEEEKKKAIEKLKKEAPEKAKQLERTLAVSGIYSLGTNGDVLVTYDNKTSGWNHGHTAIVRWDNNYIIEAMPTPGVRYHQNNWKSRFISERAFYVSGAAGSKYTNAARNAASRVGKPYAIYTSKTSTDKYYCSKLVWQAWRGQGWDLDADGGYWVFPVDLERDAHTIRYWAVN